MKFSINRKSFIKSLRDVKKGSVKRLTDPKKAGMAKIMVKLDTIDLTVYGEQSEMTKTINDAHISEMGGFVAPLSILIKILPKLKGDSLTISTASNDQVNVNNGKTNFDFNVTSIAKAPNDMKEPSKEVITINGKDLKDTLKGGFKAAAREEYRPVLTGLDFIIKNNKMRVNSTDSHQLFTNEVNVENKNNSNFNMIVPVKDLTPFYRLMDTNNQVTIKYGCLDDVGGSHSEFIQNHLKINIKNIEGNYPDVSQCYIDNTIHHIIVNRLEFKKDINQVKVIAKTSRNNIVLLHFKDDKVYLTASSLDLGNIKTNVTTIKNTNQNFEITFNPDFMLNALNTYTGVKNIKLDFLSNLRPFTVKPIDNTNRCYEVTPVRTF